MIEFCDCKTPYGYCELHEHARCDRCEQKFVRYYGDAQTRLCVICRAARDKETTLRIIIENETAAKIAAWFRNQDGWRGEASDRMAERIKRCDWRTP